MLPCGDEIKARSSAKSNQGPGAVQTCSTECHVDGQIQVMFGPNPVGAYQEQDLPCRTPDLTSDHSVRVLARIMQTARRTSQRG